MAGMRLADALVFLYFDAIPSFISRCHIDLHSIGLSVLKIPINPLKFRGSYSTTSNNMKLVYCPLMGGLLHLVQRGGDWTGPQPAQAPLRCTKCNSPPINGQYTNRRIAA